MSCLLAPILNLDTYLPPSNACTRSITTSFNSTISATMFRKTVLALLAVVGAASGELRVLHKASAMSRPEFVHPIHTRPICMNIQIAQKTKTFSVCTAPYNATTGGATSSGAVQIFTCNGNAPTTTAVGTFRY